MSDALLKSINFMSRERFDSLTEINDDELYAVKLDEIYADDSEVVHKTGDEEINDVKTFTGILKTSNNYPMVEISNTEIERGTLPTEIKYCGLLFEDKNGDGQSPTRLGDIVYSIDANGDAKTAFKAWNFSGNVNENAAISIVYPSSGNPYATAPTPDTDDNSTKIATTEWCYDPTKSTNLVHRTGDEEINGIKTFNDEIYAPNQVDYTQITNCITEIPQDISLSIREDKKGINLPVGNHWYCPNGFESDGTTKKFREHVVSNSGYSATTFRNTSPSGKYLLIPWYGGSSGYLMPVEACFSGSSAPTVTLQYNVWYDTTNNTLKYTSDTGSTWIDWEGKYAFPIALVSASSVGVITSIDQIFNGFGYIGSTIFALPGVKGLIPNGRNADGSLKNKEFTFDKVFTTTVKSDRDYIISCGEYWIASRQSVKYNEEENLNYFNGLSEPYYEGIAGYARGNGSGVASLTPKLPFRAVDYNDFNKLDSEVAKLGVDNTFTGSNTFTNVITSKKENMNINFINPNYDSTTIPEEIQNQYIIWEDKNGVDMSYIQQVVRGETGNTECNMVGSTYKDDGTRVTSAIKAGARRDGTVYTSAPTPPAGDNSFQIATTEWCYDPTKSTNLVHRTGDERIGGNKTFTSTFALEAGSVQPIMKSTAYTKGTAPESDTYMLHRIYRENGNKSVFDEYYYIPKATNRPTYILRMQNVSSADATGYKDIINAWYDGTNSQYSIQSSKATAPTPSADSNTTDIATTAWVNTRLGGTGITSTELGYLDGVTSNIQTQLNGKQASGSYVTTNSAQTISAVKTFSAIPKGTKPAATNSTTDTQIPTTGWVNDPATSTNVVHRSGNETIAGTKTFSSTINGTAMSALWADLAEHYETDYQYPKGTLVKFGGSKEITIADDEVNAVISSQPGLILNGNMENSQPIALCGKVPVRVIGKVNKFDYLHLSSIPGVAESVKNSEDEYPSSNVIARALEDKDTEEEGLVLCVVKFEI